MIKNPNRAYKERRFERLFGAANANPGPNDVVLDCFIRMEKRRIEASCVFNEYLIYLRQKSAPAIYDDNYFRMFWALIVEIKAQINLGYVVEFTLRDMRKVYVEFKREDMVQVNQKISNLLRFHNESPAMLDMTTQLHKYMRSTELRELAPQAKAEEIKPQIEATESKSQPESNNYVPQIRQGETNYISEEGGRVIIEGSYESSDSEDEDPLKGVKKDSFKVVSQPTSSTKKDDVLKPETSEFIDTFNFVYGHSKLDAIASSTDMTKLLGLRVFDNTSYKYCATYPTKFVLPMQMTDSDILEIAKFRTKGRMPILSYVHKNTRLMYRSGQISAGLFSKRSEADEMLLYYLGQPLENMSRDDYQRYIQNKKNMGKKTLKICDARSYAAAYGNKLMGAGFENCEKYYINCMLSFHSIANIHDVKNSAVTIFNYRSPLTRVKKGYHKALGDSKWYEYISDILEFAVEIAETLKNNQQNVLVHCSDGWDRTSQMAGIVQILLDRKARTIGGFLRLIEKEFSDAGFNFSTRNSLFNNKPTKYNLEINERREILFVSIKEEKDSPILLQFLDCVRQIILQRPDEFEFTVDLLNDLAYVIYLGIFREMLFDCQAIRMRHKDKNSMYDYFEYYKKEFLNPEFIIDAPEVEILDIKTDDFYYRVWNEMVFENVPMDETNLLF